MKYLLSLVACLALLATPVVADDTHADHGDADEDPMAAMGPEWMKAITPGPQHEHLASMVGDYKMTIRTWMDPESEPMVTEGTATRTMELDGRVLEESIESSMMGIAFTGVSRTGYDNIKAHYWSTWTDSMGTGIFVSEGHQDGDTITFKGMSPDPKDPSKQEMMTVVTTMDDSGNEVATFYMGEGDAKYRHMEIVYARK